MHVFIYTSAGNLHNQTAESFDRSDEGELLCLSSAVRMKRNCIPDMPVVVRRSYS